MSDDDWVKLAMNDDVTVADLLFRLRKAGYERRRRPPPPRQPSPPLKLYWSVRQRRSSKPIVKKKSDSTRASPTTPLSWSGATSVSGGGCAIDGFEESSKPSKLTGGARSKVSSVKGEPTTSKRPRKKKTLAELKEEETLLLRERKKLKTEIATMLLNIEKQKATKENFNRFKLELDSPQKVKTEISYRAEQVDAIAVSKHGSISQQTEADQCNQLVAQPHPPQDVEELENEKETGFCLPDLNLPADTDFSSSGGVVLYGIS
ncbi:hypothetical protein CsatA_021943 [Cannabis sativa]